MRSPSSAVAVTTMMSSGRVLKSSETAGHDIVTLPHRDPNGGAATRNSIDANPAMVDDALLFTAAEVEDLCEKARGSGAADAGTVLEPALHRIAAALEEFGARDLDVASTAQRSDAGMIVETALTVARWILGRELADPQALADLVENAMDQPLTSAPSTLFVHPDLAVVLGEIAPANVEVVADKGIAIGEFRSTSSGPDVSFRFDVALGRAQNALLPEDSP